MIEILGNNLEKAFKELGIKTELKYKNCNYEIWQMEELEYKKIDKINIQDWKEEWGWLRTSEGSNQGEVNAERQVNGNKIKLWIDFKKYEEDYEGEEIEGESFEDYSCRRYSNLSEYLCDEVGCSQPKNVCACAVDLAKQNNMTMAELFDKCEGNNQVVKENK